LDKVHVSYPGAFCPVPCHGKRVWRLVEPQHRTSRPNNLSGERRNMAQAAAEIEYAHARGQTCGLQNHASWTLDDRRLLIEACQLLRVAAQDVLRLRYQFLFLRIGRAARRIRRTSKVSAISAGSAANFDMHFESSDYIRPFLWRFRRLSLKSHSTSKKY